MESQEESEENKFRVRDFNGGALDHTLVAPKQPDLKLTERERARERREDEE